MKNFGIITINHNRPNILNLWCAQIKRLRYDFDSYIPAVCVSGEDDKAICDKYNVSHFTRPNNPVSEKFNVGFMHAYNMGWDYVTILGSDNLISTELMRKIVAQMDNDIDLIGINAIYFYCGEGVDRGKLVKLQAVPILGVAKTISKRVLDCIAWRPFPTMKNWGIDAIGAKTIKPYVQTAEVVEGVCVDVKTRVNINRWTLFAGQKRLPQVDPNIFYNILSEEEKQLLLQL